jgi:cell division protein FtsQ
MTRKSSPGPARSSRTRSNTTSTSLVPVVARQRQWILLGASSVAVLLGVGIFVLAGGPGWVQQRSADVTSRAGFAIAKIDIEGLRYTPRLAVHAALGANDGAILFTDLNEIRARVEAISWVERAQVIRKLPDRLEIHITERKPFAIWQHRGRLAVIDVKGRELTGQGVERFTQLPLVVGEGAAANAQQVFADMGVVPGLLHRVDSVVWVGNRRWDVRFHSGEILMLPEGRTPQQSALKAFAELQNGYQLLGRGKARFDMRLGDRMFVARTEEEKTGAQVVSQRPAKETSI